MLELFILETCPYCQKVMNYMDEKRVKYIKTNTKDHENAMKLITIGGKDQVPFLYNDETDDRIYESDEIVEYIRKRV